MHDVYHPAVAIAADSVFSDVICDTSWGYTPSKPDGYTGILVVIDRLSKFPFAFPLKSSQTSSSLISEYKTKVANYAKGNKNELISVNPKELKNNEIYNHC
jgi:hypothetical protein